MRRLPGPESQLYQEGVLVRLRGVDTGYDGPDVLRGVDFEARAGEVGYVAGPTSAGKATVMHMVRLALPPRAGQAIIMGADVQRLNGRGRARIKRQIGYVGENPTFVEEWSALENIAVALKLAGRKTRDF